MRILGIESSCDETAVALVTGKDETLQIEKNLIASQVAIHAKYGGVVPEVAARSHVDAIFPLLLEAGIPRDGKGIDAIAVTAGPGLVPALRVGVELAKALAYFWQKPLVAVNHLEGHIYSVWLKGAGGPEGAGGPKFPALALLVSGGHTEIISMKDHGAYELLGMTRDDAAGEAFDKVGKLLGLAYPGGPAVSKCAEQGNPSAIAFPRPMIESGDLDFSFAGLKTAVAVWLKHNPLLPELACPTKPWRSGVEGRAPRPACAYRLRTDRQARGIKIEDVCASFQAAVVEVLVTKTLTAVDRMRPASVILSGGVSANVLLRETLGKTLAEKFLDITYHVPDRALTGDNAAMIAAAGYFRAQKKDFKDPLSLIADPHMRLA